MSNKKRKKEKQKKRIDRDSPWKRILSFGLQHFMLFFFPQIYDEIDWSKPQRFLDKELLKISPDADGSKRHVDALVELSLKNGNEIIVILHIEVQGEKTSDFELRMLLYRCYLRNLYDKPIVSLAVLIDNNPNWRPTGYREELWGSFLEVGFPIIKLIDYRSRKDELFQSNNPFAHVILAQLEAMENYSDETLYITKTALTKNLYRFGWPKSTIMAIYTFLDWTIRLNKSYKKLYHEKTANIEQELKVSYISTAEWYHTEKGIEKGRNLTECEMLLTLLKNKFNVDSKIYKSKIKRATSEERMKWLIQSSICHSIDEVFEA